MTTPDVPQTPAEKGVSPKKSARGGLLFMLAGGMFLLSALLSQQMAFLGLGVCFLALGARDYRKP